MHAPRCSSSLSRWACTRAAMCSNEKTAGSDSDKASAALSTAPLLAAWAMLPGMAAPRQTRCLHPQECNCARSRSHWGHGSSVHCFGTLIFHGLSGFAATTTYYCIDELPTDTHNLGQTLQPTQEISRPSCNEQTTMHICSCSFTEAFSPFPFWGLGF